MVLYLIGLGLGDEKDITLKGLEAVKSCSKVFLESYTSVLLGGADEALGRLSALYDKEIVVADRHLVESAAEQIYEPARDENVALLVVGDPVCATTHTDIMIRAKEYGCKVHIIHNASVMGAAGSSGLQLYNFGQTISIPLYEGDWKPTSFVPKMEYNQLGGMHTLCLLDIKVKEPDFDAMMKGKRNVFLPPRFMTIQQACAQLIEARQIELSKSEEEAEFPAYHPTTTLCVGLARLGQPSQQIVAGTLAELMEVDFGGPLHSLIVCGDLHDLEIEALKDCIVENSNYQLKSIKEDGK